MPKYDYRCNVCFHDYMEVRDVEYELFKPNCVVPGCSGTHARVL